MWSSRKMTLSFEMKTLTKNILYLIDFLISRKSKFLFDREWSKLRTTENQQFYYWKYLNIFSENIWIFFRKIFRYFFGKYLNIYLENISGASSKKRKVLYMLRRALSWYHVQHYNAKEDTILHCQSDYSVHGHIFPYNSRFLFAKW